MEPIRFQIYVAQLTMSQVSMHLSAADAQASAGDPRETERQLRLALDALDTLRKLTTEVVDNVATYANATRPVSDAAT